MRAHQMSPPTQYENFLFLMRAELCSRAVVWIPRECVALFFVDEIWSIVEMLLFINFGESYCNFTYCKVL